MKKPNLVIMVLIGLIVVLSVVKAVVHNRLSTEGVFIAEIEKKISFYKTQNVILSSDLLTSSSLTNIKDIALESGFTSKDQSLLVIKTSRPLVVKR